MSGEKSQIPDRSRHRLEDKWQCCEHRAAGSARFSCHCDPSICGFGMPSAVSRRESCHGSGDKLRDGSMQLVLSLMHHDGGAEAVDVGLKSASRFMCI